ncbi:MAG: LPS export ABC transporter periplasmic protein LptC [Bacteroidetes bacterium]|nr:LPS export ABC transporter periplasmic protein LptC [Bacteroidota bacterium]MDA1334216.1 LPS export ABC transporter periplasmic protein LptC [Bacteroidota bacterium]
MTLARTLPTLLILLPLALACRMHDSGVTVQTLKEENAPASESWNTSMQIMEDGKQRLTMNAEYMARWETPDSTWMILSGADEQIGRVTVIIFDADGDTSAVVTSQQITYQERARRFEARGDVQVLSGSDRSVQSEHLSWSELTARVSTPGFATITTPTEQLSGYGLDADENLADFSLARVSGTVLVEDE